MKLIIDGNHLTGRCRATLGELTTSSGEHSGVIMGFLKSLLWSKNQAGCDLSDCLVCWDAGRSSKRMELLPTYKSGRAPKEPTEEDIYQYKQYINQIYALSEVLGHFGCAQVRVKGVEADDLCSLFASFYSKWDSVLIHSGDKDFHQCVTQRIGIFDPKEGPKDERAILDRWKLPSTEHILWYRILVGDSSDKIGGVGGIGDVWANRLLQVATISGTTIAFADSLDSKLQKKIALVRQRLDIMTRNYQLMRLPRVWEESFYTPEQQLDAIQQVLNSSKNTSEVAAMKFLNKWELESVVQVFGRF